MKKLTYLIIALSLAGGATLFGQDVDSLATLELEEVVVTGQYEAQSLKKSVYQVRTIDKEVIQLRNPSNVQSILNTELGIRFSTDPVLGTSDVSLMGMSGQNVKILIDGVPMVDRGATRESLNQVDVNSIERIEIVEGPMSVTYGTDALAGVINIITKKASADSPKLSLTARVLEETAGDEYQLFHGNGVHNQGISGNGIIGNWNVGGGISRNNFGGWNLDDAVTSNRWLPKDQTLANGTLGFRKNGIHAWYRLDYVNENIFTPGGTFQDPNINNNAPSRIDKEYISNRFTHQAQTDWKISERLSFNGILSYQTYSRRTRTTIYNLETEDVRLSPTGSQDKAEFNSEVLRAVFMYRKSKWLSIQSGADINWNKGFGDRIDGERSIHDYALFASSEIKATKYIDVRPGLRFIYNTVYDAPPVIPSINTKIILHSHLDLRLAYARGFRAPSLRELYFTFFDASHSIRGNTELKAEFSNSFTGSLAWQIVAKPTWRLKSTLGGFYNVFDNLITLALDPTDPAQQINTYVNIYRHETRGGTLTNSVLWKNLEASIGASYIGRYNDFSENDDTLPVILFVPEVNTTVLYRFPGIGASANLFFKYTGSRNSYQTATVNGQTQVVLASIQELKWADISLTKNIGDYVILSTGIKNLFNVTQLLSTATDASGHGGGGTGIATSYGRSYFVGMTVNWNKN